MPGDKPPAPRGNDLAVPFLFVPACQTPPEDWLWAHPGAIRIPATVTLRRDGTLAGIEIAQNEGDNVAAPLTARGFAPVPGQIEPETPLFPLLSDVARRFLITSGLENFTVLSRKFENGTIYDKIYRNLPERNIKNTKEGYYLYNSGKILSESKK